MAGLLVFRTFTEEMLHALALALIASCNRRDGTAHTGSANLVESIDSRQIIYEGETWIEVTIIQQINPKAPAYVDGIRGTKWDNRLRWSLFKRIIDTDRVTSCFRFKPVGDAKALTLTRDDFEWYPSVAGFPDVDIAIKETVQPGADQPATRPAEKAPAEVQPPIPTSKEGAR